MNSVLTRALRQRSEIAGERINACLQEGRGRFKTEATGHPETVATETVSVVVPLDPKQNCPRTQHSDF